MTQPIYDPNIIDTLVAKVRIDLLASCKGDHNWEIQLRPEMWFSFYCDNCLSFTSLQLGFDQTKLCITDWDGSGMFMFFDDIKYHTCDELIIRNVLL